MGPLFSAFRGTQEAVEYYKELYNEVTERLNLGLHPINPEGELKEERFRLVVEGPPNWTNFREFWKIFYDMGAVIVASTYTKVGGLYDLGFRHEPEKPLESLAKYCMGCYTNLNLPQRVDLLEYYIKEYKADGFLINSIKSCNSFSAGQLLIMREIEQRCGVPVGFIESDLVDPRYFSMPISKTGWSLTSRCCNKGKSSWPRRSMFECRYNSRLCAGITKRFIHYSISIRYEMKKYYLGVDLGSTTSKAVIINEDDEIIGRGITNTRANYSVAADIARMEAIYNARFRYSRGIWKKK